MVVALNTEHLKRYKDIAWLFVKYGRSDFGGLSQRVGASVPEQLLGAEASARWS